MEESPSHQSSTTRSSINQAAARPCNGTCYGPPSHTNRHGCTVRLPSPRWLQIAQRRRATTYGLWECVSLLREQCRETARHPRTGNPGVSLFGFRPGDARMLLPPRNTALKMPRTNEISPAFGSSRRPVDRPVSIRREVERRSLAVQRKARARRQVVVAVNAT